VYTANHDLGKLRLGARAKPENKQPTLGGFSLTSHLAWLNLILQIRKEV